MTETIKSLKGETRYTGMLAPQENEREIITIPLKKKETLEITNVKLSVHDSKKIKMSVLMINVRSITPIKKDKIRVQFHEPKEIMYRGQYVKTRFNRKYIDLTLEEKDFSANHICRKIQKGFELPSEKTTNQYGFLMMQNWESIVAVYHNIKTNKGMGMLYVTNLSLALETDEGIVFDVPYEHILLITNHKKKVRILWREPWNSLSNFHFDFEMNGKTDSNVVRVQINNAFASYRKKIGHEFITLEQKYGKLPYDEMFNLIETRNPEFQKYLKLHVKHTFGYLSPSFWSFDAQNIISCKFAGLSLDIIKDISEKESIQRKESLEIFTKVDKYNEKHKELYDIQLEMESQCDGKDDFVTLQKSEKYQNILKTLEKLKINHEIPHVENIDDFEVTKDLYNGHALRATDARKLLIYKKWISDVPLIDCTDEYDDSWMNYLLDNLNCESGKSETFGGTLTFDKLKDKMKIRDRNILTLSSFVAPDGIPDEDIYNNAWHDVKNKIWYVYDDNLDERLQNQAISDPDHSQGMIGRRVWGFSEDQVVMFCGFPSIVLQGSAVEEDILDAVTVSRTTGDRIDYLEKKMRHFILPIIREDDVTELLMEKFGSFTLQTEAMLYSISASGGRKWMTPKMYHFWAKKYNFAEIPINERVRRAYFVSQTGGWFSAQSELT